MKHIDDAGASKIALNILDDINPRLRDPARLIVRVWGYIFWIFVAYITLFGSIKQGLSGITIWLAAYLVYLVILEISRKYLAKEYDTPLFRLTRIFANLILITWLIAFTPEIRYILGFFYLMPIFASIIYFSKNGYVSIIIYAIAVILLNFSSNHLGDKPLSFNQFALIEIGLLIIQVALYWLYKNAGNLSSELAKISWELHRATNLGDLSLKISKNANRLTQASYVLLIIFDVVKKKYVYHLCDGFELKEEYHIGNVIDECLVLANGEPFDCPDIAATFKNKTIYHKFFKHTPSSVMAEPLYDSYGNIIGVLNVGHDSRNHFDGLRDKFHEFCGIASGSIVNTISRRQAILSEVKNKNIDQYIFNGNEVEILEALVKKTISRINNVDTCVVHKLDSKSENLMAYTIYSTKDTEISSLENDVKTEKKHNLLKLGLGIAGSL